MAVEPLTLDGDEAIASLERSRIDHDPPDHGRPIPMDDLSARGGGDIGRGQRERLHAL